METTRTIIGSTDLIVERIILHCDSDSLKTCCLVNKQWLQEARKRLKYVIAELDEANVSPEAVEAANLPRNDLPQARALQIYRSFIGKDNLIAKHAEDLRCLSLSFVKLGSVLELEHIIYDTFPNLLAVSLHYVEVETGKATMKSVQEEPVVSKGVEHLSLSRLTTGRHRAAALRRRNAQEAISALGLMKLFRNFTNLTQLFWANESSANDAPFVTLLQAGVRLKGLKAVGTNVFTPAACAYFDTFGSDIQHLDVAGRYSMDTRATFGNSPLCNLKYLSIDGMVLNSLGNGRFAALTEVKIDMLKQDSMEFVSTLPVLKKVTCNWRVFRDGENIAEIQLPGQNQDAIRSCTTVSELCVNGFHPYEDCIIRRDTMFQLFPNVKQLKIQADRRVDTIEDFDSFLNGICIHWNGMRKLELDSCQQWFGLPDAGAGLDNYAAPRADKLAQIVDELRDLETFICDGFRFEEHDSAMLLRLPKLRTLHLGEIQLSETALKALKEHLYEIRVTRFVIV